MPARLGLLLLLAIATTSAASISDATAVDLVLQGTVCGWQTRITIHLSRLRAKLHPNSYSDSVAHQTACKFVKHYQEYIITQPKPVVDSLIHFVFLWLLAATDNQGNELTHSQRGLSTIR